MDILKIIQEYMKCYKENCKDEYDNIGKDKKLQIIKNKLKKNKNWKEIDKIIFDIYSNRNQKDFELCVYKKCSIVKDFQEYKINSLNKRLKNVIILLTELAKSVKPHQASSNFNAPETINTKLIKQDFLSK
jgi:hypothetical protein